MAQRSKGWLVPIIIIVVVVGGFWLYKTFWDDDNGPKPPPEIIVIPDEGGGDLTFELNGTAMNPVAAVAGKINEVMNRDLRHFYADVKYKVGEQEFDESQATAHKFHTHVGTKLLKIYRGSKETTKGGLTWELDGTPLADLDRDSTLDLRNDLMGSYSGMELVIDHDKAELKLVQGENLIKLRKLKIGVVEVEPEP